MSNDPDLDAAWAAVHDATPTRHTSVRLVWRSLVMLGIIGLVALGCGELRARPDPEALAFLELRGEVFAADPAPRDIADWRDAMSAFQPGSAVDSAVYGVIRCVEPSKACTFGGVPAVGRTRSVWILGFGSTPSGSDCPGWAIVELEEVTDDVGPHVEPPWCAP